MGNSIVNQRFFDTFVKNLIIFCFFGVSLQSYYSYEYNLPILSIFFVISLFAISIFFFKKENIFKVSNLAFMMFQITLLSIFWLFLGIAFSGEMQDINTKRMLFLAIFFILIFIADKSFNYVSVRKLCFWFLILHILPFYLQFFSFYLFNYHIDFLSFYNGESQRVFDGEFKLLSSYEHIRPSGLFVEPGTYATFVAPIVALFGRWSILSKKELIVYSLGLISMFLSFSLYGIIFGLIVILFNSSLNIKHKVLFSLGAIASTSSYLYWRFYLKGQGLDQDLSGFQIRSDGLNSLYQTIFSDVHTLIFGDSVLRTENSEFYSIGNDVGLYLYLIQYFGLFFIAFLTILFLKHYFFKFDSYSKIAIIIVFLSKQSIFAPFFILTLFAIFIRDNNKKNVS